VLLLLARTAIAEVLVDCKVWREVEWLLLQQKNRLKDISNGEPVLTVCGKHDQQGTASADALSEKPSMPAISGIFNQIQIAIASTIPRNVSKFKA